MPEGTPSRKLAWKALLLPANASQFTASRAARPRVPLGVGIAELRLELRARGGGAGGGEEGRGTRAQGSSLRCRLCGGRTLVCRVPCVESLESQPTQRTHSDITQ